MKVNHVWYGDSAMGPLELFNIYSWLALGHAVTIYAHNWDGTAHTASSLGVDGAVKVKNLSTILTDDEGKVKASTMPNTRDLLKTWILATNNRKPANTDFIFNLVDVTKSYIGGTRQGIVLDLKAGPSKWLPDYAPAFNSKFVSYSRGGNTTYPENQCMGSMEAESGAARGKYAAFFDNEIAKGLQAFKTTPNGTHFGLITVFHGKAWNAAGSKIDVSMEGPSGGAGGLEDYVVDEIGSPSHGPFRVFKHASDQTNKSNSIKTKPADVAALAQRVWDGELKASGGNAGFLTKVEAAMKTLPGYKAPQAKPLCPKCNKPFAKLVLPTHERECKG